jgi:hypothetical protein
VTLSSAVFAAAYGYASGCQIPLHQLFAGAWAFVFAASNPGFSHFFTRLKPIFHIKSQHVATWTGLWLELHLQHHPVSRLNKMGKGSFFEYFRPPCEKHLIS